MSEFLKNLRNNQKNYQQQQKPEGKYKGQQRHDSRGKTAPPQKKDVPEYLKALFDDLAPSLKKFLNQFADSQVRLAAAGERQAEALEKMAEGLPGTMNQADALRKAPRRRRVDERKQEVLDLIKQLRDENMTYEEVAAYLDENSIPTFSGRGRWHAQTIHRLYMYYP